MIKIFRNNTYLIALNLFLLCVACWFFYHRATEFTEVTFGRPATQTSTSRRILLINTELGFGGGEVCVIHHYKMLKEAGYAPYFLVAKNAELQKELMRQHIPHIATHATRLPLGIPLKLGLLKNIAKACTRHNIDIIHCSSIREVNIAKKLKQQLPVKVVFTLHLNNKHVRATRLAGIDGCIGVSPTIRDDLQQISNTNNLNISPIQYIHPFYDEKTYLSFRPTMNKIDFFEKQFGITIDQNVPLICCIGALTKTKNQQLLLKALDELRKGYSKTIQAVFAGRGKELSALQEEVKAKNLEKYVHFLGFTKQIPEIIAHADALVSTSTQEPFGIIFLEGALLKTPLIGPTNTGATCTIIDGKTGLLYENNNAQELAQKIKFALENSEHIKLLARNAYTYVRKNLSNKVALETLLSFYDKILKEEPAVICKT